MLVLKGADAWENRPLRVFIGDEVWIDEGDVELEA